MNKKLKIAIILYLGSALLWNYALYKKDLFLRADHLGQDITNSLSAPLFAMLGGLFILYGFTEYEVDEEEYFDNEDPEGRPVQHFSSSGEQVIWVSEKGRFMLYEEYKEHLERKAKKKKGRTKRKRKMRA